MINRPLFRAGSDVEIRESFRKFVKDNQFARAAAAADATGLSLQQAAEREGHILKASQKAAGWLYLCCSNILAGAVRCDEFSFRGALSSLASASSAQVATRKSRSERSFDCINRAASLFNAWMKTQPSLQEKGDRKDDSIFYPSSFKVTCDSSCASCLFKTTLTETRKQGRLIRLSFRQPWKTQLLSFIEWQERRASLALQDANPDEDLSGAGVQWWVLSFVPLACCSSWPSHALRIPPPPLKTCRCCVIYLVHAFQILWSWLVVRDMHQPMVSLFCYRHSFAAPTPSIQSKSISRSFKNIHAFFLASSLPKLLNQSKPSSTFPVPFKWVDPDLTLKPRHVGRPLEVCRPEALWRW